MSKIISRRKEKELLNQLLKSKNAEFLALYGRRRIGKTYLIRNFFEEAPCVFFHVTGVQDGKLEEQLELFIKQVGITFYNGASLASRKRWMDAFEDLTKAIQTLSKNKKVVLFFDEFPWMATRKAKLLQALDYYWNRYWVNDPRLKLIVCGSSASWIIKNIINNKGGLYNRITYSLKLEPLTLGETRTFLKHNGIKLNHQQILNLYMVIGGVPHYLSRLSKGKSVSEYIDELCFQANGLLFGEFENLFKSLFHESEIYLKLCRIIAKYRYGIGQVQLLKENQVPPGGRTVLRLKELEDAGFIMSFIPYGHKEKGVTYKIIDEYTLFYFHWIEPHLSAIRKQDRISGYWLSKSKTPAWRSWIGYAFEAVCYKHLPLIRKALHMNPGAEAGTWRYIPKKRQFDEEGAQIDLLFDRPDGVVTLCEIKYTEQPFSIDKAYAKNLLNKIKAYQRHTHTQKQIFMTMITAGGLKPTLYSEELVAQHVNLEDLFKE